MLVHREIGLEDLEQMREEIAKHASGHGLGPERIYDLLFALTELVTNSLEHGYQRSKGYIEVEMVPGDKVLTLILRDKAEEFDPLELEEPDLTIPLEQRSFGGLGIYLTRKMVDRMTYRRLPEGINEIVVEVAISPEEHK